MVRPMTVQPAAVQEALQGKVAGILASWFGCGKVPQAPGTVGALGALPLYLVLRRLHPVAYAVSTLALTATGVWAAQQTAEALGDDDPRSVVIDEVAGALMALGFVARRSARAQALAWVLFRVLDIWKPGPINDAQKLEPEGIGIMADDVLAGLLAGITARLTSRG